jgi:hydroxyacylglutathione hydrolase
MIKKLLAGLGVLILGLAGLAIFFRFSTMVLVMSLLGSPPLQEKVTLGENEHWFDDYYTVEQISSDTFAIGEPRYHQQNYSYLLVGEARAILFDSGTPMRDITPVIASLTDKPVTVIASHLHFDHVGNHHRFDKVAMLDTPSARAQTEDGWFRPTSFQHLGSPEGFERPKWQVDEFLVAGSTIDLGNRTVTIFNTPGHTDQSVSLLDREQNLLLTGDYIYEGPLFTFLPNSSLPDYLITAKDLQHKITEETRLLGAHRVATPGAPILSVQDLRDLELALANIRDGISAPSGAYPANWPVNDRMTILTDIPWLLEWGD